MFFDRWSTKVQLPLGPKWGNNIGGVAACLNWSGGRQPKPPPKQLAYKNGGKASQYVVTSREKPGDYTDRKLEERYVRIIPWQEDLGISRVDGKLKITGRSGAPRDDLRDDDRKQGALLPPSGYRTSRALRSATPARGSFSAPPPPTPPPRGAVTPGFRRTATRPANPSPHTHARPEVYSKYTERELIIEDIDDDADAGRKSRSQSRNRNQSRNQSRLAHAHYGGGGGGGGGGGASYRPQSGFGGRNYYSPEVVLDDFRPSPLVWQTHEFDDRRGVTPETSRHGKLMTSRARTPGGGSQRALLYADDVTRRTPVTSRSSENVTIHVDCSKLVNQVRPGSLTVRLHGVEAGETGNLKIKSLK